MAKLTVKLSDQDPTIHLVGKRSVLIGRSAATEVQIDDPSVSGCHAQLVYCAGVYTLTDLKSTNGTRVNGQYIKTHLLRDADRIRFGQVTCIFEVPAGYSPGKNQTKRLLRVSRHGKLLGFFTPDNARESLKRGELRPDDTVWHEPVTPPAKLPVPTVKRSLQK